MIFNIRGDKVEVTDSIREYIVEKLSKIEKYFGDVSNINAKVLISVRGREQKVEITITSNTYDVRVEVSHSDLYAAVDLAIDKIERQIRKYKTKLLSRERIETFIDDFDDYEEDNEKIVKRKKVYLKPMDEEEAITQMELLGHTFFIFKNIDNEDVEVLYKRYDGSYGVIETN